LGGESFNHLVKYKQLLAYAEVILGVLGALTHPPQTTNLW